MANPNIVNVTSILAGLATSAPANTSSVTLITNAVSSGTAVKVSSLYCTNVTGNSANVTVAINNAGTSYRLANNISVPGNSALQIVDKNNFLYLTENSSLVVTSGTSGSIEYIASYEIIS